GGKTLAYLTSGVDGQGHQGDGISWLKMTRTFNQDAALYLGSATSIGAPPLTDPRTGRILMVINENLQQSSFSTIDPICGCNDSQREFDIVHFSVNWATYDPTGTFIVFSEDKGNLYQLDMTTKTLSPLIVDQVQKHRPTSSPDGTQLAYFDD